MEPKIKRPVKPNKWYVVDTDRISLINKVPRLFKREFDNNYQAQLYIRKYLGDSIRFDYIKGSEATEIGMTIMNRWPRLFKKNESYGSKYEYNEEDVTTQNKKVYRTRFRRHQRAKKGEYYKRKA